MYIGALVLTSCFSVDDLLSRDAEISISLSLGV